MPDVSQFKVAFVFNRQRSKAFEEAEFDTPEVIDTISNALRKQYEVKESPQFWHRLRQP